MRRVNAAAPDGSPPRAWGQCVGERIPQRHRRFTPTGVGTIIASIVSVSLSTVHPHGRGDNATGVATPTLCAGSPPRAWGQCRVRAKDALLERFTPTGVGTI